MYDLLYYDPKGNLGSYPGDVIWEADKDYSTEAAAYEHLIKAAQIESFEPEYQGTWTFSHHLPTNGRPQTRHGRMLLMERLHGSSFRNMRRHNDPDWDKGTDSFHYPREYRLQVLARAMDGFVK
ncbi:hypothetical protein VPNG_03001 [Cytospora leucostoma]|uniref:Uncharacterized protein n=1 Tax=Cytospora leucostoma TaxID=1230097 RepID=A0A423XGU6_9PEZI|nr:hypothetical protein VPNG_03001 [Cytospora leucostoma]